MPKNERPPLAERLETHAIPFLACLLGVSTREAWQAPITVQIFDDTPAKDERKAKVRHGSIQNLAQDLERRNLEACGIFVSVNTTNLTGRTKPDHVALRAAHVDLDGNKEAQALDLASLPLQPTMAVTSGHGTHLYWCYPKPIPCNKGLQDEHEALLRGIQEGLEAVGADPGACTVDRVLRVPGFYNMKREPVLVEVLTTAGPRHTPAEVAAVFPPSAKKPKRGRPKVEPWAVKLIRDLGLEVSEPRDLGDGTGYRTGCPWSAEHTGGEDDRSAWLDTFKDGEPRHWECPHGHCQGRGWEDVVAEAGRRGVTSLGSLPEIIIRPPEHQVAAESRKALSAAGGIFQRGGQLVAIQRAGKLQGPRVVPPGTAEIVACSPAYIRERLSAAAKFLKWDEKEKGTKPAMVPQWLPFTLTDGLEHTGFPNLVAVVETPVFLPEGRVLANAGMDAESGIFLEPLRDFPLVPERPSRAQAQAAADRLFEVVQDFEFSTSPKREAHRAAWLGLVLTVVGRYAVAGPVPLGVLDAAVAGSGKGLLARITSIIATGRDVPVMNAPRSGEEFQKAVLPILQAGTRFQLLDEAHAFGGGPELNGIITGGVVRARILGTSRVLTLPNLTVFIIAGNNMSLQDETPRRALPIRLEPTVERPEDRDGWAFPDLVAHVQAHQAELLRDALTILRAFHVAGRPASGLKPWGSFEAWSRLVRDAVFWATDGVDLDCRPALATGSDLTRTALRTLVEELRAQFGDRAFGADELVRLAHLPHDHIDARPALAGALHHLAENKDGQVTGKAVGRALLRHRRRIIAGYVIDHDERQARNGHLWRLIPAEGGETWQSIA